MSARAVSKTESGTSHKPKTGSVRLNEKSIRAIEPPATGYRLIADCDLKGFGIRVTAAGVRSFTLTYTVNGLQRRYTIGEFPTWSATAARKKAEDLKRGVSDGHDPLAEKQERRDAMTFGELAAEYLERYASKKRSGDVDKQRLDRDVLPEWKNRKAADIKRADVLKLIEAKAEAAPIAANRLLACIRKLFNWAISRDLLETSPCLQVKKPAKENPRDRVLTADEIRVFWSAIETGSYQRENEKGKTETADLAMSADVRTVLRFILATAQRPGEVCAMEWGEIDGSWWTVPSEKAKNGLSHRVHLAKAARELLDGRKGESRWVFPSRRGADKPIEVNALAHALRNNDGLGMAHFTPHDLRRTAASHMAGAGVPRLVVKKILNHVERDITAVYDRHGYDAEKKAALEKWARKLRSILDGKPAAKVVSIG
jgi:integrase